MKANTYYGTRESNSSHSRYPPRPESTDRRREPVPGSDTGASNSTWQSLSRNTGNVETDYFNGEIVRIAHQHGITAPLNAALARASRDAVRNQLGPSHFSAAQLSELLGIP